MNAVDTIASRVGVTSTQAQQGLGALCYIARQLLSAEDYGALNSMVSFSDFENIECILAGNNVLRGDSRSLRVFGGEKSPYAAGAFISGSFKHIGLPPEDAILFLNILKSESVAANSAAKIANLLQ